MEEGKHRPGSHHWQILHPQESWISPSLSMKAGAELGLARQQTPRG